jgi:hypothetical protein
VPVRQIRVAELDDDVAVLSSGQLEETRDSPTPNNASKQSAERRSRGRGLSSVWQIDKDRSRSKDQNRNPSNEGSLTNLQRAKSTRFLGSRWRSRRLRKKLESSSPHLGNLFSDHGNFRLLHGNESKSDLGPSLMLTTAVRKKRSGAQRRMTKQEKRREPGVGNEHFSICKNRFPR